MNIFQIPKDNKTHCDLVIGIIDASGSMEPHWEWLATHWNKYIKTEKSITITFDTIAETVESNILDTNLHYHGGGGTNLPRAFQLFEKKLSELPEKTNLTVLFVSDGKDNNEKLCYRKLEKLIGNDNKRFINFLTLGIGKDFPTSISMKLREKYHNGDESLPALFLIEYPTEKVFTYKFEMMKEYFSLNRKRRIEPVVCTFPWREYTHEVFENSWVMAHEDRVEIDGKGMDVSESNLSIEGICELFRSWAQMIHLEGLVENENIEQRAKKTLTVLDDILEELKEVKGIDLMNIIDDDSYDKKESFKERAWRYYIKNNFGRLKWYYDDIKNLAKGNWQTKIDEFDMAKRIGIGTIVGSYAQKVLNINNNDFIKMVEEFRKIYKKTKLIPYSSQDVSIITLENQKDIFLEPDFLQGLNYCKNIYDLTSSFPLIGAAIKIKRDPKCPKNPWKIQIQNISKTHRCIDSSTIIQNDGNLTLNVGEGKESINAVLPLFSNMDKDVQPLITSKLYNFMMTKNVLFLNDGVVDDVYLSLLANSFLYLVEHFEESDFWRKMVDRVFSTGKMISESDFRVLKYMEAFGKDPVKAFETDESMVQFGRNAEEKGIFVLFCLWRENKITEEKVKVFLEYLFFGILFKFLKEKNNVKFFYKVKVVKNDEKKNVEAIENSVREKFKEFFTKGDLRRKIESEFSKNLIDSNLSIIWTMKEGLEKIKNKINYKLLKNLSKMLIPDFNIDDERLKMYVCLAYLDHKPNHLSFLPEKTLQIQKEKAEKLLIQNINKEENLKKTKKKSSIIKSHPLFKSFSKKLSSEFRIFFKDLHKHIIPPSKQDLMEYAKKYNVSIKEFKISSKSKLIRNACNSKKCHFYLKPNLRLGRHLDIWGNYLPKSFHNIVFVNRAKSVDVILKKFCEKNPEFTFELYETTKEETVQYIYDLIGYFKGVN